VKSCEATDGNEIADQLAKLGSVCKFTGSEPDCNSSMAVAKKVVRDQTIRDHRKHWDFLSGLKQAKAPTKGAVKIK
jgi:hypothetical protein